MAKPENWPEVDLEAEAVKMRAVGERASVLMAKDPKLPYMSAVVIASDQLSDQRSREWVEAGTMDFDKALPYVGSFGRLDFMLWAAEHGHTTRDHLIEILPEYWAGSDPDDTDPRFLVLWLDAHKANEGVTILDGDALPPDDPVRVYRGQDIGVNPGISWTLDRDVAERFAKGSATRQGDRGGEVIVADVARKDVIAYLTGRNEHEVIFDPGMLPMAQLLIAAGRHRSRV